MRRALGTFALLLLPAVAEACASCVWSPFGDRTYNWPYLGLILAPFGVGIAIGGVMMRVTGVTLRALAHAFVRLLHSDDPHKETT